MSEFVVSQALAMIAFGCGIVSFQTRSRRALLLWLSACATTNACHFFILSQHVPAILFLITGGRCLVASLTVNRKIMYLFFGLILSAFSLTYRNPLDIPSVVFTLLSNYASFQKRQETVRLIYMFCTMFWIVHNILVQSPVAALMEATFLTSNVVGYWRLIHRDQATSLHSGDRTGAGEE